MTNTQTHQLAVRVWMEAGDEVYSVAPLNLPGAVSCGDTEEEAIANIKEAALGIIEEYEESGESIRWKELSNAELSGTIIV